MRQMLTALALGLTCGWPTAGTAQDLVFNSAITTHCMVDVEGAARLDCAGASAMVCMDETPGGDTTVGMGGCLNAEYQFWDAALNDAYRDLLTLYGENDAAMLAGGWSAPEQVPLLKAMQRVWITYRDARCDFERAKWGGGSGGGPATYQCLLEVTAAQTLVLRDAAGGLQ